MIISQCIFCKHKKDSESCNSFPQGIPEKILFNEISHCQPVEGDNGILFEAKDAESQELFDFLEFGKLNDDVVA